MNHHTTRVGYNLLLNCYPGDYPICLGSSEEWKTRMFEERQRKLRDIMQLRNPISPPSLLHFWNKLKCDRWERFLASSELLLLKLPAYFAEPYLAQKERIPNRSTKVVVRLTTVQILTLETTKGHGKHVSTCWPSRVYNGTAASFSQ